MNSWLEATGVPDNWNLQSEAREAMAVWLSQFTWDWYCTHTFKGEPGPLKCERHWTAWLEWLRWASPRRIWYVRVTEYQKRGVVHYHSLIGGVRGLTRLWFKDLWERHGISRVLAYDSNLGAGFYLGKYLNKPDQADIRFSNTMKLRSS